MFELTNEQRRCFALPLVENTWKKIRLEPSKYDMYDTFMFCDGDNVKKIILAGENSYHEYGVNETLSSDGKLLMPKTAKGKPTPLTAAKITKRTPIGMSFFYGRKYLSISNNTTIQHYFDTCYSGIKLNSLEDVKKFIEKWCADTGENEQKDIDEFAARKLIHHKYREGDFFRYRINRELWGYGRILLDFNRMRKENIPYWHIFMGKPLCVAVYHIAVPDKNISPEQLVSLPMLPSQMIMDDIFYYGECEIIGNKSLTLSEEDYPIHYGRSISWGDQRIMYQCGRTYLTLENEKPLYSDFHNNGIGWGLEVKLPVLMECIESRSNLPYWNYMNLNNAEKDLRNPKYHKELSEIKRQFNLEQ